MSKIDIIPPSLLFLSSVQIFLSEEFYFHSGSIHGAQAQSAAVVVCLFSLVWLWTSFLKKIVKTNRSLFLIILIELSVGAGAIALFTSRELTKPALLLVVILPVLVYFSWSKFNPDATDK